MPLPIPDEHYLLFFIETALQFGFDWCFLMIRLRLYLIFYNLAIARKVASDEIIPALPVPAPLIPTHMTNVQADY